MRDKKRHRAWYALTNKSGAKDKDRGEVEVVLRWAFEEALERFVEEGFDEHGDECLAEPNELCVGLVPGPGRQKGDSGAARHASARKKGSERRSLEWNV